MAEKASALECPSAQPDMVGARVFGVIVGATEQPEVAYLKREATVNLSRLKGMGAVKVTEVFRIAATCEQSRCVHFDGSRCSLGGRIVEHLQPVVDALPPCTVRPTCRWYAEQGREVCLRCPQLVTLAHRKEEILSQVASPPATSGRGSSCREEPP
jgi:hypothetical protein